MKLLFACLLLCCQLAAVAQNKNGNYVKVDSATGFIFIEQFEVDTYIFEEAYGRFTPSTAEVIEAEKLILQKLKKESTEDKYLKKIYDQWSSYGRQYVGFIDATGEKVIWVNYFPAQSSIANRIAKEVIDVEDGGCSYWNIKVNMPRKKVFDMMINSMA